MNREIKFRAWDKKNGYLMPVESIDFNTRIINYDGVWRLFDEVFLMQYTGLTDKNNVRICESDVIEDADKNRHIVTFKNGGFGREGRVLINYHTEEYVITHEPLVNDVIEGCQVIGNIYENPELLKER